MSIFTPEIAKIVGQFGLGVLFFIAFMFLLKWVLNEQKEERKSYTKEREHWREIFQTINNTLKDKMNESKMFYESQKTANQYHRDEHREIMQVLRGMNGKTKV